MLARICSDEDFSSSKHWLYSSAFWGIIAMSFGVLLAIKFVAPDFLSNLPQASIGRIRPSHVLTALFGFVSMGLVGAVLYIVPRLTGVKLWSERLGNFTMVAWNLAVLFTDLTLLTGHTEGREYAEQIAPIAVVTMIGLVSVAIIVFRTVQERKEKQLYISLWYFMGTFLWFPLVYLIGHRSFVRLSGLNDAAVNWFYGHNVLGLWFTTLGVGVVYYLIPIISRAPLFSHKLSLIGFWSIAMVYAPTGAHHLLQAPIPEWLKSAAIVSSLLLLIPVFAAVTNFLVTVRGRFDIVMNNLALRWTITGVICYLITCLQGPFQAARPVNWYIHFTNWVVAHAHIALLGSFGFFVYGATYHMIPRITGRRLYSVALGEAHYWLVTIGFIGFFFALTMAGLEQASMWNLGVPEYQVFVQLYPLMVLRFLSGVMMLIGHCIFAWMLLRTVTAREPATPMERAIVDAIVPPAVGS